MKRFAVLLALVLAPPAARADARPRNAWEIEYTLTARLRLSDTMMGAAAGVYPVGPGRIVLRYDNVGAEPGGTVKVTSYDMTTRFTVAARFFGIGTTVASDTTTRGKPNVCGVIGMGRVGADRVIRWSGPWNGIHTDGHLKCSGTCGRFGAPPKGTSAMHMPPHPVAFAAFTVSPDKKTLHMGYTVVNKTSSDTARLTFDGRETRRRAVHVPPCP
jgi:hypothetical protein